MEWAIIITEEMTLNLLGPVASNMSSMLSPQRRTEVAVLALLAILSLQLKAIFVPRALCLCHAGQ